MADGVSEASCCCLACSEMSWLRHQGTHAVWIAPGYRCFAKRTFCQRSVAICALFWFKASMRGAEAVMCPVLVTAGDFKLQMSAKMQSFQNAIFLLPRSELRFIQPWSPELRHERQWRPTRRWMGRQLSAQKKVLFGHRMDSVAHSR